MGSLRTPVGPLPSSIYWRRRVVLLLLIGLLVALVVWALRAGSDGGSGSAGKDDGAGGPATSITPGPSADESLIDERPGGREENDEDGDGEDAADAGPGADGGGEAGGEDGEDAGSGDGDDAGGSGGSQVGAAAVAGLPDCRASDVTVSVRPAENAYAPGEKPQLRVTLRNSGASACKTDFGHRALTVELSDSDDEPVWSSAACPKGPASLPARVPAEGTAVHTLTWDRRHSPEDCDGPAGPSAEPGTYLAQAELSGFPPAQTSFRLEKD
ncbi:hypothetical protein GCM10009716_39650 [Streptomyces sodiiphilus]|uniref:DUF4232 domain-containing protein n=1 Tax=Streptomyces sodiiphilus TaxID=226217 RepID=A0ABN2PSL7_9ACTN